MEPERRHIVEGEQGQYVKKKLKAVTRAFRTLMGTLLRHR